MRTRRSTLVGHQTRTTSRRALRRFLLTSLVAVASTFALGGASASAALDNAGTEFWLGFPSNYDGGATKTLFITGSQATTGTVQIPGLAFTQAFTVTPGTVTSVELPGESEIFTNDGTENKGIHVTAAKEIVVYGLSREQYTTDAYLGLPVDVIGTANTVLGWGTGLGGESEFSIVSIADKTSVTITPSIEAGLGRTAGTPYTITLNKGEEYQLKGGSGSGDLSGTRISSSNPVSVFSGHQCANVPSNSYVACDHVVEQNPPEATWGKSFLTVPLKTRTAGDTFQFVADQNNTQISINGALVATLNAGQHYNQIITGNSQITSSKAILVAQYSNSSSFDGVTSDPFEMHIPPFEQFQTGYTITTPASGFTGNFVNLVVPNSEVGNVKVDGVAVPAASYSAIGASGFKGAQVDVTLGSHTLTGNGQPFGAFVYGFADYDSYGYPGGLSLAPVASVTSVTVTPANATNPVNTQHCVIATVKDQNGSPLAGVRVDFVVSGANSASGSVNAASNGQSEFCYTGTKVGADTITASVGTVSGTAHKTWTAAPNKGSMAGEGRLTGAGVIADFAYVINCTMSTPNQRLAVIIKGVRRDLVSLQSLTCTDAPGITPAEPAPFDTMEGDGTFKDGKTIHFKFVDAGVGGDQDSSYILIKNPDKSTFFSGGPAAPAGYLGAVRPGRNTAMPAPTPKT